MQPFAERRRRLLDRISGVAIFPSAPVSLRNSDVEYDYRQDSDLFYLTGFSEPESVLVLSSVHKKHKQVMFVQTKDPERELWDGERAGVEDAVSRFGMDAAFPIGEFETRLPELLSDAPRLHYKLGKDRRFDDQVLSGIGRVRGRGRTPHTWPTEIVDPAVLLHEMRARKAEDEIARMRRAAEITRDAHVGAMRLAAPGKHEYELEAHIREVFRRSGSERTAYLPIVGSGPNATVLHYRANKRRIEDGELVLIDAGCEFEYYASDVTRTFPVSGSFSAPQRHIYEIVLEAQLAAIEAVKPGATLEGVHDAAVRVIVKGLIRLSLLSGTVEKNIEDQTYRRFYMHRTSHWLGMDVHDVGPYFVGGKPRKLEVGMALTVEPGIYIRPGDDKAPAEYRGIGVRIEDDVIVTATGRRELTSDIPKTARDVERACEAG
jgi:Xaa-Pro aminopeptidase